MYKAENNLGLFRELSLVLDYIEEDSNLDKLDFLFNKFKRIGLTRKELDNAFELINNLPKYLECDNKGCYITQVIDDVPIYTNIDIGNYKVCINEILLVPVK